MRRLSASLTLMPAILAAQAVVPAQAPSFADQFKAQSPAIEALQKTDPAAALAKAEAMIPAATPAFDKTDIQKVQKSMNDYDALTDLYSLAANAAQSCGQWEKAKDYLAKAKATAQANYDNAVAPLSANQDSWKKAQSDAQKNLDEEAALIKNEHPNADQIKRMEFLQIHEDTYKSYVANGSKQIKAIDDRLGAMKTAPTGYDTYIESADKRLKDEADNIAKYKGDKKAYAAAALKSFSTMKDKDSELAYLRRLQVLDPSSKAVARKIDVLMGKAVEPEVKRVHKKKAH